LWPLGSFAWAAIRLIEEGLSFVCLFVEESVAETSGFMTDLPQSAYLSLSIKRAISAAQQRSHRYVMLEHVVLALLDDPSATEIMDGVRADIPSIRREITETVNRNLSTLYAPGEAEQRASYKVERVLQSASDDASRLGCTELDAAFVIAAMSRESDSPAAEILKRNGVSYSGAVTWLYGNRGSTYGGRAASARSKPASAPAAEPPPVPAPPAPAPQPGSRSMADALARVSVEDDEPEGTDHSAPDDAPEEDDPFELELEAEEEEPAVPFKRPAPSTATPAPTAGPALAPPMADLASKRPERAEPRLPPAAPPAKPAPVSETAPHRADPEPIGRAEPAQPAQAPRKAEHSLPPASRLDEMRVRPGGQVKPRPAPPPPAPSPAPAAPAPSPEARRRVSRPRIDAPVVPAPAPVPASASGQNRTAPADRQTGRSPTRRKGRPQDALLGRLIENIPRRMRAAKQERIEVRISREDTQKIIHGMEGRGEPVRHDVMVTQTMSVALRAPDGGFTIEPISPETQWIFDRPDNAETYGRWRWMVTPHYAGQRRLQLIVAARSVNQAGLLADSALPDQIITVRVRTNYLRSIGQGLKWLTALVIGGVLTELALIGLKMLDK
jgi:hypothetical protein